MRGDLHTLKRVCAYASVVMLVGEAAFVILILASAAAGIISFSDAGMREWFTGFMRLGEGDLSLAAGTAEAALAFIVCLITVKTIHDMMVSIRDEHSPFTLENASRTKTVSITFLVSSIILSVLEFLNRSDATIAVCMLLLFILIGVVMYCLTIVFRYGALLQKESDETL